MKGTIADKLEALDRENRFAAQIILSRPDALAREWAERVISAERKCTYRTETDQDR